MARANRDGHVWQRGEAKRATFGSEANVTRHDLAETKRYKATSGTKRNDTGHVWRVWVSCFTYGIGPGAPCPEGRRAHERPGPTLNHERERALAHVPQGSHRSFDTHGFTERWSPRHLGTPKVRGCSYTKRRKASASDRKSRGPWKSNFGRTFKYAGTNEAKCGISDSNAALIFGCEYSSNSRSNQFQVCECDCGSTHASDLKCLMASCRSQGFGPFYTNGSDRNSYE